LVVSPFHSWVKGLISCEVSIVAKKNFSWTTQKWTSTNPKIHPKEEKPKLVQAQTS
jgi:hypothetical protein